MSLIKNKGFDYYWHFTQERQNAFISKSIDTNITTQDKVILNFRFTNTYRCLDRVSQFLIANISNNLSLSPENTFFQTLLFKIFNKIETWTYLSQHLQYIDIHDFNINIYSNLLSTLREQQPIYSSAYILPSGTKQYGSNVKHINNLSMLEYMIKKEYHKRVWECQNLEQLYHLFLLIPSLGSFLAYQYAIDIAYSSYSPAQEKDFIVAGPGAIRGIYKCFSNVSSKDYSYIIQWMAEHQHLYLKNFYGINNRPLQLIDCQNIFCEVDKYLRVVLPELKSNRQRIKQKYIANHVPLKNIVMPLKWGIKNPF